MPDDVLAEIRVLRESLTLLSRRLEMLEEQVASRAGMSQLRIAIALAWFAAFGLAAAAPASAHTEAGHRTQGRGSLASEARVSMKAARATALARVPHGKVQSAELEREHGKLIYSFDIRVPGRSGIEEVQVDAIKGVVVSMVHEGPKAERKEVRQEKLEHGK